VVTTAQIRLGIDARPAQQGARQFRSEVDRLEREIRRLNGELDRVDRELRGVGQESRRAASGFSGLEKQARSFLGAAAGIGAVALAVGAIGREASAAAQAFAEIDRAQRRLQATARLDVGQSDRLRAQADQLGASTPFSITQVIEAQQNLAQAGLGVEDILRTVEPSLRLASAAQIELGNSSQIVVDTLKTFRLESSEAARVADVLVGASTRSSATVTQLAEALGKTGAVANQLGLDLETTVGLLGTLANGGPTGRGSEGGTGLRTLLASIVSPSEQVRQEIAQAGINVDNLAKLLSIDTSSALDTVADRLNSSQQLFQIFGREGAAAAAIILANRDNADALTRALRGVNGEAQRFGELVQGGPAGTIDRLRSAREARRAAFGEAVSPFVDEFNQAQIEANRRATDLFQGRLQDAIGGRPDPNSFLNNPLRDAIIQAQGGLPPATETRETTRATEELNAAQAASEEITRRVTEATRGLTDAREALRQAGLTEGLEDDVRTSLGLVNELSRAVEQLRAIAQEGGDAARIATPQFLARRGELAIAQGARQSIIDRFTRPAPQTAAATEPEAETAAPSASSPDTAVSSSCSGSRKKLVSHRSPTHCCATASGC
jgi:TP901 family phage tail tape measure protein